MDWVDLFSALALMLIIEGLLPFLHPKGWKKVIFQVLNMNENHLRLYGLSSMLIGVLILNLVR